MELLAEMHRLGAGLPDPRTGANGRYEMADFAMAAFSCFFMQSPSFLAYQRQLQEGPGHGRCNCLALFAMTAIPCDNSIRKMLDPVVPAHFDPMYDRLVETLEHSGGLAEFRRLGGHTLIALDGTEYFISDKLCCPSCSRRRRSDGKTEYFHSVLAATLVAPGHTKVVPLPPEFVVPQDGHDKQDCESRAARRWLDKHGSRYRRLDPIYLGDDLYSCQPVCEAVSAVGGHFIFVCKPASHPVLQEYLSRVPLEQHSLTVPDAKRRRMTHRFRWMAGVPLRDGKGAMKVNWLEIEIVDPKGKVTYRNSFVTDLPIDATNAAEIAACGRARWKIENETFNTLKNRGYNLEHNFGHGKQNLAAVLVTLNLIAFAIHTVCELADQYWRRAREVLRTRTRFFSSLLALTSYVIFSSWPQLLATLAHDQPPPAPS